MPDLRTPRARILQRPALETPIHQQSFRASPPRANHRAKINTLPVLLSSLHPLARSLSVALDGLAALRDQGHPCPTARPAAPPPPHQPGTRWERDYLAAGPGAPGPPCERLALVVPVWRAGEGGWPAEEERDHLSELVGGVHREFGPHCRGAVRVHVVASAGTARRPPG